MAERFLKQNPRLRAVFDAGLRRAATPPATDLLSDRDIHGIDTIGLPGGVFALGCAGRAVHARGPLPHLKFFGAGRMYIKDTGNGRCVGVQIDE